MFYCDRCQTTIQIALGMPATFLCSGCDTSLRCNKPMDFTCSSCGAIENVYIGGSAPKVCSKCSSKVFLVGAKEDKELSVSQEFVERDYITCIILTHNGLEDTKECIQAVRASSGVKDIKIVVVDNGSTDGTTEWMNEEANILYIYNPYNIGCALGRNQGAKWANSQYLWFLDNDQFVAHDTLRKLIQKNKDLAGVELWDIESTLETTPSKDDKVKKNSYVGAGGLLVKAEVFNKLGGFDERYAPAWYEDVDFSLRARIAGHSIGYVKNSGVVHKGNSTISKQVTFDQNKAKQTSREVFGKIWGRFINMNKTPKEALPVRGIKYVPTKPLVNILVDVPGWAWDNKARQIKRYLSDEFRIEICYIVKGGVPYDKRALLFTFDPCYENMINSNQRWVTGVTSHTYTNMKGHREFLQSAIAVHANSKLLVDELKQMYGLTAFYLPNGVDEVMFNYRPRAEGKPFTAGYVGKNIVRKGFEKYVVPACEEANVRLLSLTKKVNHDGVKRHQEMPSFYEKVDVILIASDMDGTPNQLLEAGSIGRTFIANRIGNVPEFVKQGVNGYLVKRQLPAYVAMLRKLKKDRELCVEMGKAARRTVEQDWTWKIQAENYREFFRRYV